MTRRPLLAAALALIASAPLHGQTAQAPAENRHQQPTQPPPHVHEQPAPSQWHFMQDGVVFGTYNRQGGLRGTSEFASQNWWMLMGSRQIGQSMLTLSGMVSLEPATTRPKGYAEIFQIGETYNNAPLVDYQHPHDFLMQLAAVIRIPLGDRTDLRLAVAPVGEAGIGPPAFMHRRSSAENPTAPLTHHTFDSSHITMGVVAMGLDYGAFTVEGAAFHGREPDEERWDIMDPGPLDSWSVRLRFRPAEGWELQGSHGFLKRPEILEPQDVERSTASVTYVREGRGENYTALTFAAGRNKRRFSIHEALLGEISHRIGRTTLFGRYEGIELETEHLLFPGLIHTPHEGETIDPLHTVMLGGAFDVTRILGWELAVGGDVQLYRVPPRLQRTHGDDPISSHVFFRLRVPKSPMGRMWNMMMSDGMKH